MSTFTDTPHVINRDLTDVVTDLTELVAYHGGICAEYVNANGPSGYIVYFSPLLERRIRLGRSVRFHTAAQARVVLKALQGLPV